MANKTKKPVLMAKGHTNSMQTPPIALEPLYPYLKKQWTIWECAAGKGNLAYAMLDAGYRVKWSDIIRDPKEDFLKWEPRAGFDAIVTNPPYDIKDEFLARAYSFGKPFAMLLPLTALESEKRQSMYRRKGIQLLLMNKRINFETPNGGKSSWFATAWFRWKLNLPHDLTFYEFQKEDK